jgi:hypothetical protein
MDSLQTILMILGTYHRQRRRFGFTFRHGTRQWLRRGFDRWWSFRWQMRRAVERGTAKIGVQSVSGGPGSARPGTISVSAKIAQ